MFKTDCCLLLIDETKNNWEVSALSQAAQKGFNKVVLKHLKKTTNISSVRSPFLFFSFSLNNAEISLGK
jgi:hypothetical protein